MVRSPPTSLGPISTPMCAISYHNTTHLQVVPRADDAHVRLLFLRYPSLVLHLLPSPVLRLLPLPVLRLLPLPSLLLCPLQSPSLLLCPLQSPSLAVHAVETPPRIASPGMRVVDLKAPNWVGSGVGVEPIGGLYIACRCTHRQLPE